jgi:hypothetical protein
LGVFSVTRTCSRTQVWPACVAPAKNNFICASIVNRDKPIRDPAYGMRGAVRSVTSLRSIRMRERDYNFSAHFRAGLCGALPRCGAYACVSVTTTLVPILEPGGAHTPYCANDCQYCHATRRKLKLRIVRSVKFHACRPICVRQQIHMTLKMPLIRMPSKREHVCLWQKSFPQ